MAIHLHAFYPGRLPSKAAFTCCFKELGFPVTFDRGLGLLESHRGGGLPMRLRGVETGFELDRASIVGDPEFADIEIDPRRTHCASLPYFADVESSAVAVCFAATLVEHVNGMACEPQVDKLSPDMASGRED
jgi:hypothetical protein